MLFTTDKQTLDDLNIFGKHGSDAIYTIFNRTITRGGAALLEDMFRYPLADAEAINRRSAVIQYFAAHRFSFPFESADIEAIEAYLANTDERTRLTQEGASLTKKLGQFIAVDTETAVIYKGVTCLVALLGGMQQFIAVLGEDAMPAYEPDKVSVALLLATPALATVLNRQHTGKLPQTVMVEYDAVFRFRHRDVIRKLLHHMYMLDVYLSVAKVAVDKQFVFPKAMPREQQTMILEGVYHPQVKGAVANSIHVTPENNVLFLTGANMAGKSTFMKSVSIALFLAHMGFPVAATKMEFAVFDGIYTTINLPDNLGMGASHFYAEVLRVKKMAHELSQSKRLFILFDELFRGTNVKDAYEATIAITTGFALRRNSMFIISTHIIEAGDVLREKCSNVHFIYLPTRMNGNTPVYTYQLEQGITADRHGMVIINNEGILDILKTGTKKFSKSGI